MYGGPLRLCEFLGVWATKIIGYNIHVILLKRIYALRYTCSGGLGAIASTAISTAFARSVRG
jgi:hypothetical protein